MSANVSESYGTGDAHSATPTEAERGGEVPLHQGLPDEIAIWEILVLLPPKALLRCRTVCQAWQHATSSNDFLLTHHGHQPALSLLYLYDDGTDDTSHSLDIVPLDHRAGVPTTDQLRAVARLGSGDNYMQLKASCDGLLILATVDPSFSDALYFSVCNPATRQYAPLPFLRGFRLAEMYLHRPTSEYRLLLYPDVMLTPDEQPPGPRDACYVYAVGSCQPPRHIGWPEAEELIYWLVSVLCRGNLHWYIAMVEGVSNIVMVFDATAEVFRQMCAPDVHGTADLFEMDGMLGLASFKDYVTPIETIDIWMTQDYDSEAWALKFRVELPVAELTMRFGLRKCSNPVVSSSNDNDLLILVESGHWLLQIDTAGKLVARFYSKSLGTTLLRLKQTLVQHTFFPAIEGYVVNTWPFI